MRESGEQVQILLLNVIGFDFSDRSFAKQIDGERQHTGCAFCERLRPASATLEPAMNFRAICTAAALRCKRECFA